jgi:hypothetical protein
MATQIVLSVTAATAQAQAALASLQSSLQGLSSVRPTANFSGLTAGVGTVTAALAGLAATVAGVGVALNAGLNVNAVTETSVLGVKALIASLTEIRDAQGQIVNDPLEKLGISAGIAREQVEKLRLAGLETAASAEQLVDAFRQGIGAGSSAGLALDDIRNITLDIVKAAGTLGVPMDQLNQEVRSLLSADIGADSSVARALSITNEQVKGWREAGTLAAELQKRFEVFRAAGAESGATWTATLANISEAISLFLGKMTEGAFGTLKTALQDVLPAFFEAGTQRIKSDMQGLADFGTGVFDSVGDGLASAVEGSIELMRELSGWLDTNSLTLTQIGEAASAAWTNFKGILGTIASVVTGTTTWATESGFVTDVLRGAALLLASIQDGISRIEPAAQRIGAALIEALVVPLTSALKAMRDIAAVTPLLGDSVAKGLDRVIAAMPTAEDAKALEAAAKVTVNAMAAGDTAVLRTLNSFRSKSEILYEQQLRDELRRQGAPDAGQGGSLGTSRPRKAAQDAAAADKAANAAARAAEQLRRAERQLADAEVTPAQKRSASLRETEKAQLEAALADQLVSYEAYLARKAALDNKAIDEELAAQRLKLKQLQDDERDQMDPARKVSLQADVVKANADIDALEQRKVTVAASVALDVAEFKKTVASLSVDIKANILDATGGSLAAGLLRLGEETSALLKDRRVAGNAELEALVRQQSALRETRLRFEDASGSVGRAGSDLSGREADIARQVEQGQLTQLDGERALRQARLASAAAMRESVTAAVALAAATNDPALIQSAAELERRYKDLAGSLDTVAVSINESFFGSIKSGFSELITGAKSFGDVLTGIISNVLSKLADLALDQALGSLTKGFGGAGGGLGGLISGFLGSLGGFSGGGGVRGEGTGTSDSILARLSNGEYVLRAAAVKAIGAPRLDFMNKYAKMPAFAAGGGPIGGGGAAGGGLSAMSPNITNQISVSPNIVIPIDRVAEALMQLPAFERGIIAKVGGNGNKIQSAWGR